MTTFNLSSNEPLETLYQKGLLPQRNQKNFFYLSTSCRSNLSKFTLSSENKRIINKTADFNYQTIPLSQYHYNADTQKQIHLWLKELGWDFPTASVKNVFTNHIFNQLHVWSSNNETVGYSIILSTESISHIAYVFYNPIYGRQNLPIRMVLQPIIDSQKKGLKYCYLGQFSSSTGYYKRTMPGFEYFEDNIWKPYNQPIINL